MADRPVLPEAEQEYAVWHGTHDERRAARDLKATREAYAAAVREQAGGGLRAAAQQAVTDFRNYASHIDDVGGSGGDTLRASADALECALVATPQGSNE